jgi:hypothetical protein
MMVKLSAGQTLKIILFLVINCVSAYAQETMNEHLQFLMPCLNKTWKGIIVDSTSEKPMYDVSSWQRILNGQAVRILHSVNDGLYGGETLIYWDKEQQQVVYYYFTTAGFYTHGFMKVEDDKISCHEYVTGNQRGITEVRSNTRILADGKMEVLAEFLQNGKWIFGHKIVYSEDTAAKVVFH